jgi:hypothetical protein
VHVRVVRRARVKFWFIKNYMSPQMKRFLPAMAARYGFEYSTVTYKWPSWLHKQACAPLFCNCACMHACFQPLIPVPACC